MIQLNVSIKTKEQLNQKVETFIIEIQHQNTPDIKILTMENN